MSARLAILTGVTILAVLTAAPAHLHGVPQVSPEDHAQHHPATGSEPTPATPVTERSAAGMGGMMATDARLDALVAKMNAATGQAKVDAMAELLAALVQDRQAMGRHMGSMMSMMQKMGGMHGSGANR